MGRAYAYGPVPSRRLGLSLGVDTVAAKTCPLDCVYCQLGPTGVHTAERRRFFPLEDVVADVQRKLADGPRPDHITLGGSGEPTLSVDLGALIGALKAVTDVPVALLTGGALFDLPAVRAEASLADLVLPSLDAGDAELFDLVARPAPGVTFERVLEGLVAFRREFRKPIWLEVMVVGGLTDTPARLAALARAVARVAPDKVQLNTPVRPASDPRVRALSDEELSGLCGLFGPAAEVIAEFKATHPEPVRHRLPRGVTSDEVLAVLSRRPCTVTDLAVALDVDAAMVLAAVEPLLAAGAVEWAPGEAHYLRPVAPA
jgi:wyosine [tRNA(Phe)-imidazoG37] synthetase (radical SAM superfamily)